MNPFYHAIPAFPAGFVRTMRFPLLSLVVALLSSSLTLARAGYNQRVLDEKVSIVLKDQPLRLALQQLEAKAGIRFAYSPDFVKPDTRVSISVRHVKVSQALNQLLHPLKLTYSVIGSQVFITRAPGAGPAKDKSAATGQAADRVVTGQVSSAKGDPLPGVTVLLKGSTTGTVTGADGSFSLTMAGNTGTLVFSFIGFQTREVPVPASGSLQVVLADDVKALEEVVVVGYGEQRKSDVTGALAQVKAKDLNAFPVISPVQGLSGRAAGVQVIQNSGEPGTNLSVRVRGGNSLRGSNEPLYVVDGFALSSSPGALNPADIESIEILKDASSTAIYGSRGANGVVLITTKKGKAGKNLVEVDSYYGVQQLTKKLDLLNAREFAEIANERAKNDGFQPYFTPEQIQAFGQGTDWQDLLFRTAPIQNHVLTFSGGNEKTQYSLSGSYFGQEGIIKGSEYWKGSLRAAINQKVSDKISLSYNSILSHIQRSRLNSDNSARGSGVLSAVLGAPPTLGPYDQEGRYTVVNSYPFSPVSLLNPLAMALERQEGIRQNYILANSALTYTPVAGLSLRVSVGVEHSPSRQDVYSPRILPTSPSGNAAIAFGEQNNILNENILTYNKQLGENHTLTATGGVTYQRERTSNVSTGATGFSTDALGTNALESASSPTVPSSSLTEWTLLSYLGRVNYGFKNKYLVTFSNRADGSSRFGRNHKWGFFPSAALAWRVIEEPFMKDMSFLSDLKLRASWGKTGSTALAPYQTLNTLGAVQVGFNEQLYVGFAPGSSLSNPDLKWESTAQTNIGLDVGLWQNRLQLTADYYRKYTSDLLAIVPLPTSVGYQSTVRNIGEIKNSGLEMGLTAALIDQQFKWEVSGNVSANRNKVMKLAGGSDVFGVSVGSPLEVSVNLVREGYPAGVFYGFLEDGLDAKGAIQYKDLNADGVINNNDKTIIGDPNPDFTYGFNSRMAYSNFELSFFLQGVQGVDMFNFNLGNNASSFYFGENQIRDLYANRWTPENPNPKAKYPKISASTKFRESDRFIENGSFLRLKNVQLAYNVPVSRIGLGRLRSIQLYASGQNLLTLTDYSWFDPEISTRGGASSFSMGIDQNGFPNARTYTFGMRLGL